MEGAPMSPSKPTGMDLLDEDIGPDIGEEPRGDTPFDTTISNLSQTSGEKLELMCRANKNIAQAATVSYNMIFRFGSKYIQGRIDQIMRLSVSKGGEGRAEMVQALQAGSGVPDSYYESEAGARATFTDVEPERCHARNPTQARS